MFEELRFTIYQAEPLPDRSEHARPKIFRVSPGLLEARPGDEIAFVSEIGNVWLMFLPDGEGGPLFDENPVRVTGDTSLQVREGASGGYTCVVYVPAGSEEMLEKDEPPRDDNLADAASPPRIIIF
jgi:hypothetical protein